MPKWRTIVCGVDSLASCANAIRFTARLAREDDAKVYLLHVESTRDALTPTPESAALLRRGEARVAEIVFQLGLPPMKAAAEVGDPADVLNAFARRHGCDLIVLGCRARNRAALAFASVAGKVIASAPCPVVIVPAAEDAAPSVRPRRAPGESAMAV